jgi:hypothetical protein
MFGTNPEISPVLLGPQPRVERALVPKEEALVLEEAVLVREEGK